MFFCRRQVHLVGHHDPVLVRQKIAVMRQLENDRLIILERVPVLGAGHVNDLYQDPGALGMLQELMPQPLAQMRAFNEAGNIGDDKFLIVIAGYTQIRFQSRKRIVGNFWTRVGNMRK